jgi:hypothetical protein
LISNWSNSKRLKVLLKHESELKAIERKADMRREVYLNAAEELVRANNYLSSLSQVDLTKTNIGDGLQSFFVSSVNLRLVAEEETGKALNELIIAYGNLLFKLMIKPIPIIEQKNEIYIINGHYAEAQTEIKRILTAMNRQNESGAPDERIFTMLDSSFQFKQKRLKELADERNKCWEKANEYTREFIPLLMNEMKMRAILQAPVIVGIRKELDIDTNIESYKEMINSSYKRVREQLDNFLASIDDKA